MIKVMLLLMVFAGNGEVVDVRSWPMSDGDACWEAANSMKKIKPPERGAVIVACKFEDEGPTT